MNLQNKFKVPEKMFPHLQKTLEEGVQYLQNNGYVLIQDQDQYQIQKNTGNPSLDWNLVYTDKEVAQVVMNTLLQIWFSAPQKKSSPIQNEEEEDWFYEILSLWETLK